MEDKADCCTWFPERFRGDLIHQACCQHDYDVSHYYNPLVAIRNFWVNLKSAGVHAQWRLMIITGATLGVFVRFPYFIYLIYTNRKNNV